MDICDAYSPKTDICPITTPVAHYTLDFRNGTIRAKPIITEADRIRAKSDEELAAWFRIVADCEGCPAVENFDECRHGKDCEDKWLDWLRQEAKEEP